MNKEFPRRKILVIDDEPELLALLKELLEEEGYQVVCASSGTEGIHLNERENPDLIILDLRMPGISGINTLRQIRKTDPDVRVVILTGYGTPDSIRDAAELKISEYLNKPFENETMLRIVSETIWRGRTTEGGC